MTYRCPRCHHPEGSKHDDACPGLERTVSRDGACWSCRAPAGTSHLPGCALLQRAQYPRTVWGAGWQ